MKFRGGDSQAGNLDATKAADLPTISCPENRFCPEISRVQGRIYTLGFHVGKDRGDVAYNINPVYPQSSNRRIYEFDSTGQHARIVATISGTYRYCAGYEFPSEENAFIDSLDASFDYLDFWIPIDDGDLDRGTDWAIRLVLGTGTIEGVSVERGDLLVKEIGERYRFCDADGCYDSRPDSPYQIQNISEAATNATFNTHYAIPMSLTEPTAFSYENSLQTKITLETYSNFSNALSLSADPESLATPQELLEAVQFHLGPWGTDWETKLDLVVEY